MEPIVVMNQFAREMRNDKTLRARLLTILHRKSTIIEAGTVDGLIETLEQLSQRHVSLSNVTVYVVGGDGTFNQVLNWVLTQPAEMRPMLMPVGGGQFNFMRKYVGLKSTDPAKNLAEIYSGRIRLEARTWRPVCIEDSLSGERYYGAVIGNGILSDFVECYEESGKGDVLRVVKLIGDITADFFKNSIHGRHGRVKPRKGTMVVDGKRLGFEEYAAFMAATVPEFMPTCRPFHKAPGANTFPLYVYWGDFGPLAASIPMIWYGWASPLTDLNSFNDEANHVTIKTKDPRLLVDGDIRHWKTPAGENPPERTLTLTYGPEIKLLHAV